MRNNIVKENKQEIPAKVINYNTYIPSRKDGILITSHILVLQQNRIKSYLHIKYFT